MILPLWSREPELDATLPYDLFMRTTPTEHGTVIVPPRRLEDGEVRLIPDGPIPTDSYVGQPKISPRRYSVAKRWPGNHFELIIGSTYYHTGWDSEDYSEPFQKFINHEFVILYRVPVTKTVDMHEVDEWSGSAQELQNKFGFYISE